MILPEILEMFLRRWFMQEVFKNPAEYFYE